MTDLPGHWDLTLRTPIGSIETVMVFTDQDGVVTGTATAKTETVPLTDVRTSPTEDGEHVTWSQSISKPMRLDLVFDVSVHGDTMHGHSRAGRLPRSTVTGTRRSR